MSADEIRRLADLRKRVQPDHRQAVVLWPEHWEQVRDALIDFAAMVERCDEVRKNCEEYQYLYRAELNTADYILKGDTNEHK